MDNLKNTLVTAFVTTGLLSTSFGGNSIKDAEAPDNFINSENGTIFSTLGFIDPTLQHLDYEQLREKGIEEEFEILQESLNQIILEVALTESPTISEDEFIKLIRLCEITKGRSFNAVNPLYSPEFMQNGVKSTSLFLKIELANNIDIRVLIGESGTAIIFPTFLDTSVPLSEMRRVRYDDFEELYRQTQDEFVISTLEVIYTAHLENPTGISYTIEISKLNYEYFTLDDVIIGIYDNTFFNKLNIDPINGLKVQLGTIFDKTNQKVDEYYYLNNYSQDFKTWPLLSFLLDNFMSFSTTDLLKTIPLRLRLPLQIYPNSGTMT